jgi:translation initiation factor 2B subunit (eIF-2B alpha/beta/delta family)
MENRIYKKPFGQVKEGDTIYTLTYSKATVIIHKLEVLNVKRVTGISVYITYSKPSYHFYANTDASRVVKSWNFSKWIATTTLEEAKEICREMTKKRIKDCKEEIKSLENRIKKWENFKSQLVNDIYIIK